MKKYIWKIKKWIFFRLVFNAFYSIGVAGIPYIIKLAIDYDYSKGYHQIIKLITLYLLIASISMIFQYCSQVSGWKLDQEFFLLIKHDFFCAIIKRKSKDFKQKTIEEYIAILNNDIPTLQEYIESIIMIIEAFTQIVIYAIYLLALDYNIAIVIMISSALCLFLPNITGKKLAYKRKIYLNSIGKYMNKISDLLMGFNNINVSTRKNFKSIEYKELNIMEKTRLNYGFFRAFTIVLNGFFMYLLDIIAFSTVVISLLLKRITLGTASASLSYIKEFTFPIRSLISAISNMKSTKGVKNEIFSILNYKEPKSIPISEFKDNISFNNVSKHWKGFYLQNFTYRFKKGKKYAIIGHSGSGKSTILHLLMQQEYPDNGTIEIDNKNISNLEYSNIISYISQNEHIFSDNFENNVTVFQSYIQKNITETIDSIDNQKLKYLIHKKNCSTSSGGEKNLLSIIKLLLMDKEIFLLDEIFASLDFNTKKFLQKKIYDSLQKTLIVITHDIKPDDLKYFDEILIMENGKLIYSGTKNIVLNSEEYKNLI